MTEGIVWWAVILASFVGALVIVLWGGFLLFIHAWACYLRPRRTAFWRWPTMLTYLLARHVCSVRMALFAAVLATIAGTGFRFLVLHNWYSTLLSCLALYTALRFLEDSKAVWAFICAWCASLTFLFEQSKGAEI